MAQRDILVVGPDRIATGTFGASLKDAPNTQLAITAVKDAIERRCVAVDAIVHADMRKVEFLGGALFRDVRARFMAR